MRTTLKCSYLKCETIYNPLHCSSLAGVYRSYFALPLLYIDTLIVVTVSRRFILSKPVKNINRLYIYI